MTLKFEWDEEKAELNLDENAVLSYGDNRFM